MDNNKSVNILTPTRLHGIAAKMVGWLVAILVKCRIEPNVITALAIIAAIFAGIFLGQGLWLPAAIFILLNGLFDVTDGELSRRLAVNRPKHLHDLGIFLDPLGDRISDTAFFAGLFCYAFSKYPVEFSLIIFFAFAAHLISSWIRAKIESLGLRFHLKKSFTRATLQLALLFVCFGMFFADYSYQHQFFFYAVIFFICLPKIGTFFVWLARAIVKITTGKHIGIFS